jgi:hypothetical protein
MRASKFSFDDFLTSYRMLRKLMPPVRLSGDRRMIVMSFAYLPCVLLSSRAAV